MFSIAKASARTVLALFLALLPLWAQAGPYADSAHGNNASYGVFRTGLTSLYIRGNCAHCHEQHASIGGVEPSPVGGSASGYLLLADGFNNSRSANPYSQTDSACFQCHVTVGYLQSPGFTNNNYSATFGGENPATATSIMAAFNLTSYHNLKNLRTYITGRWGLTANSNPCSGCHNVHIAKANWRTPGTPANTAISLPSDRGNLWGDGAAETMQQYALANGAVYRAPFYVGANKAADPAKHEPDGSVRLISSNEVNGSTTPDYNTFCLTCHQFAVGTKRAINFSATGDKHGLLAAGTAGMQGNRLAPYTVNGTTGTGYDSATNFVLSCLDCHEPHGSTNIDLLRSTINGVSGIVVGTTGAALCAACHNSAGHQTGGTCLSCHFHGNGSRF